MCPSSETRDSGSFGWTRFKNGEQLGHFQGSLEVWAEIRKHKPSAFRFCLSMRFDQRAEAGAVNVIDVLKINDNSRCLR